MTWKHAERLILGSLAIIAGFITFYLAYGVIWNLVSQVTPIPRSQQWLLAVDFIAYKVALIQLLIFPLMLVPRWRLPHFLAGLLIMAAVLAATSIDFIQYYPRRSWLVLLSGLIAFATCTLTALRLKKSRLYD